MSPSSRERAVVSCRGIKCFAVTWKVTDMQSIIAKRMTRNGFSGGASGRSVAGWISSRARLGFVLENNQFKLDVDCPEHLRAAFIAMTEEVVDWRLAAYSKSRGLTAVATTEAAFIAKVSHAGGKPILFVPEKTKEPARPIGLTSVQLPDGATWEFKFVKVACNVAMPEGTKTNQLGSLLTEWFGPDAGLPGTNFSVRFNFADGIWHAAPMTISALAPLEANVVDDRGTAVKAKVSKAAKFTTHVPSTTWWQRRAAGDLKEARRRLAGSKRRIIV